MLGRGFMGRAHSIALRKLAWVAPELPLRLVALCGRDRDATTRMAAEFGYERAVFDWRELVKDPAVGSAGRCRSGSRSRSSACSASC